MEDNWLVFHIWPEKNACLISMENPKLRLQKWMTGGTPMTWETSIDRTILTGCLDYISWEAQELQRVKRAHNLGMDCCPM